MYGALLGRSPCTSFSVCKTSYVHWVTVVEIERLPELVVTLESVRGNKLQPVEGSPSRRQLKERLRAGQSFTVNLAKATDEAASARYHDYLVSLRCMARDSSIPEATVRFVGVSEAKSTKLEKTFAGSLDGKGVEVRDREFVLSETTRTVYASSFTVWLSGQKNRGTNTLRKMERLVARDGSGCVWCGKELYPGDEDATVDHVWLACEGGTRGNDNLLLSCKRCNHKRGNLPANRWLERCIADPKRTPSVRVVRTAIRRMERLKQETAKARLAQAA